MSDNKSVGGVRFSHSYPSEEYREFRSYSREWEKTYFNSKTGGYVVTHRERIQSGNVRKQEREKFDKEQSMAKDLARAGHKVEHLSDKDRKKGDTYDVRFDGQKADLKSVSSHNNIEKYVKHAVKEQGAKVVIVRVEDKADKGKVMKALRGAKRKYKRRIIYYYQSDKTIREV